MSMKDEWGHDQDPRHLPVPAQPDAHYTTGSLQVWDVVDKLGLSWAAGNVLKYLARYKHKGQDKSDLLKAFDYLCKEAQSADVNVNKEDLIKIIERHWK